jgi:hypothetical protein
VLLHLARWGFTPQKPIKRAKHEGARQVLGGTLRQFHLTRNFVR